MSIASWLPSAKPTLRRLSASGAIIALAAALSACGGASTGGTPSATATTAATATPTVAPLATPFHLAPADTSQLCKGAMGDSSPAVYAFGQNVYAEPAFALSYPSYTLPAGTAQKPFDLGKSINSPDLDQLFGGPANANPDVADPSGVIFTVCNNGSNPITLSGIGVGIVSFAPHASPIDTWQICDGAYQVGAGVTGGGCGGAVQADETMKASFAADATTGATASATMVSAGGVDGPGGYGPLPVTLKPGATILITIGITMPTTPGIYTLGITLSATGVTATAYAPLDPQLFAPVAHKWNGQNCKASAMLSQIPTSGSDYFICPA
jgi:hypothetical protein